MSLRRWLRLGMRSAQDGGSTANRDDVACVQAECADLQERLRVAEEKLQERSEALYLLQKDYSREHFELFESERKLKIERMRNAGAYSGLEVVIERARALQARISGLKERLREYERVEDQYEDEAPIVLENETTDS